MKQNKGVAFMPIGMSMGIAIGTAVGVATDNLALWLPIGIAIGSGFGVTLMSAVNAKAKKDEDKPEGEN